MGICHVGKRSAGGVRESLQGFTESIMAEKGHDNGVQKEE